MKKITLCLYTCIVYLPVYAYIDYSDTNKPFYTTSSNRYLGSQLHELANSSSPIDYEEAASSNAPFYTESSNRNISLGNAYTPYGLGKHNAYHYYLGGYITNLGFYDTRQTFAEPSGLVLVFPLPYRPDVQCRDINGRGKYNFLPISSRMRIEIFGPRVRSAYAKGVFEANLTGRDGVGLAGLLRVIHAYLQLDWKGFVRQTFIAGQTWHLFSYPVSLPDTISANYGTPIEAFGRNPQFMYTMRTKRWILSVAALSEYNSRSSGPLGFTDEYNRNSLTPQFDVLARVKFGKYFTLGAGLNILRLVPRIVTNNNYKVVESITSVSVMSYILAEIPDVLTGVFKVAYIPNGTNFRTLSGYAVTSIDPVTDRRTYTNTRVLSSWFDIALKKWIEPGVFIGVSKNLGTSKPIIPFIVNPDGTRTFTIYKANPCIGTLFRASPRVRIQLRPLVIAAEIEFTRAAFGTLDDYARLINPYWVNNVRGTFGLFYYF